MHSAARPAYYISHQSGVWRPLQHGAEGVSFMQLQEAGPASRGVTLLLRAGGRVESAVQSKSSSSRAV